MYSSFEIPVLSVRLGYFEARFLIQASDGGLRTRYYCRRTMSGWRCKNEAPIPVALPKLSIKIIPISIMLQEGSMGGDEQKCFLHSRRADFEPFNNVARTRHFKVEKGMIIILNSRYQY